MLTGTLGVRLIMLTGRTVPLPAPSGLTAALAEARISCRARGGDGFQLTFTLDKDAFGDYDLLRARSLDPGTRVVLGAVLGAVPEPLIDGIVTRHELHPSGDPGTSTLIVTGRDLTYLMSLEERNAEFPNQPDSVIFLRVMARYAQYGIVPKPSPTNDVPLELRRVPRQQETDLAFVHRLARRNGYVFTLEPLTIGTSVASLGPEDRLSLPQPALSINMGPFSNVTSLSFSLDADAPVAAHGTFLDPITGTPLPIPPLPSLRFPPLARSPVQPARTVLTRTTAAQDPAQAALSVLSTSMDAPDAVHGYGELETASYGGILRARRLVGVRGAGETYDGSYYVTEVTHTIQPGKRYTQTFELAREGTGALLPVVRP